MDEPTVIPFSNMLNGLNTILFQPPNPILQDILAKYPCFQEKTENRFGTYSKWNHGTHLSKKISNQSSLRERPKIGNKDISKEAILKKELQSLLNKLTHQNYDILLKQLKRHFHIDHMELFMGILWNAIQLQPDFQELYIHMLQQIYHSIQDEWVVLLNTKWNTIWMQYMEHHQWKLPYDLVERSHNYNDFCDYVKEKKRLISVSQAWARLINLGMIQTEPFYLLSQILQHIHRDMQIENPIHSMCIECYIEQSKEYYKTLRTNLQKKIPDNVYRNILDIKLLDLPKSCYFKVVDFIELIEKNEIPTLRKNNSIYELEDDGL